MKKIIPALSILVLIGCSSDPIKTPDISRSASVTLADSDKSANSDKSTAGQTLWRLADSFRRHTILHINQGDAAKDLAEQDSFFPRITRYLRQGIASWYGPGFHGKKTATGEIFDMYAMTAAHKTLPIPSYAEVTNLENHRKVIVRINDRGPYHGKRLLDLSFAAAKTLDMHMDGTSTVEVKAIAPDQALHQLQELAARQAQDVYLQVGTFRSERKALELQDELTDHNLPEAEIRSSTYKRSTLYKVQIGPVNSIASVDKLNQQLAAIGITDTQFVTETKQSPDAMIQ